MIYCSKLFFLQKFLDRCVTYEDNPDSEDYKVKHDFLYTNSQ